MIDENHSDYNEGIAADKIDIELLLAQGQTIQIEPKGFSMYPMFYPGKDKAIICGVKPQSVKRGDVVLYRREGSILVLHRVWRIKKCRKATFPGSIQEGVISDTEKKKLSELSGFYMVGDNQWEIEGPIKEEQIKGKLTAFIRKGKKIHANHPIYVAASRIWLFLRPIRKPIIKILFQIKRLLVKPSLR